MLWRVGTGAVVPVIVLGAGPPYLCILQESVGHTDAWSSEPLGRSLGDAVIPYVLASSAHGVHFSVFYSQLDPFIPSWWFTTKLYIPCAP